MFIAKSSLLSSVPTLAAKGQSGLISLFTTLNETFAHTMTGVGVTFAASELSTDANAVQNIIGDKGQWFTQEIINSNVHQKCILCAMLACPRCCSGIKVK